MTSRITIGIGIADQATKKIRQIRGDFDKLGQSKGAMSILQGVGMSAGIGAMNMLGGAAEMAVGFLVDSVKAASDLSETVSKSSVIFGKNADAIGKWASTMAEAGGMSKRAALDAASGFAGLFDTVGLSADKSADMAKTLTQMGSDLASFFNTDVGTALAALKSGLNGESEPLRQFNVFLSETAVSAKLAQMGIKKVGGTFTEAQKATARYQLILEQTGSAQGDYARTADGLANSSRTLQAEMENLQAEIGQELLPIMRDLSVWARDEGVPMFRGLIDVAKMFADALGNVDRFSRRVAEGLGFETDAAKENADAVNMSLRVTKIMGGALDDAAGSLADVGQAATPATKGIGKVGKSAADAAADLADFQKELDDAVEAMIEAAFGPEQLALQLRIVKRDTADAEKELAAMFGRDGKRKKGTTWQEIDELRLKISEGKEETALLTAKIGALDGITLTDINTVTGALGTRLHNAEGHAAGLYSLLLRINGAGSTGSAGRTGAIRGMASGGVVWPGETVTVGERGTETLVMGGSGGVVIPHGASGGGGTPVVLQVNLDGRVLTQVVDRNLSYLRRTAPGVAPAAR